jgi:U3 small nucleolar RNA-associated protein MPP10
MEPSESTATFEALLSALDATPDSFLQPSTAVQAASLVAAKRILDPVVSEYSVFKELALKGLDVEQVWEQIRLVGDQVKKVLAKEGDSRGWKGTVIGDGKGSYGLEEEEESDEDSLMEDEDLEESEEEDEGENQEWEDEDEDEEMQNGEEFSDQEDEEEEEDDPEADEFPTNLEEDDASSTSETEPSANTTTKPFKKDIHGLNDQFFSIDDFNRLTESQDHLPSTNNDDDDENADDIDYFGGIPITLSNHSP